MQVKEQGLLLTGLQLKSGHKLGEKLIFLFWGMGQDHDQMIAFRGCPGEGGPLPSGRLTGGFYLALQTLKAALLGLHHHSLLLAALAHPFAIFLSQ